MVSREDFLELIGTKGRELYRQMPWRENTSPYYVWVSEIMLQQTQVDRVIPKFEAFIQRFPDVTTLASSSLSDVLELWSGLGYNRRAKYLYDAARVIKAEYSGELPHTYEQLITLPGIGPNTAGAIMAYAYNEPVIFIETNIRTVYFHHFFLDGDKISDAEIREAVSRTIDKEDPRSFYWALMDYGSLLKRQGAGRNALSKQYRKQSALKGSVREIRGQIIRALTRSNMTEEELKTVVEFDERYPLALTGVIDDGLVTRTKDTLHLTK